MINIEHRKSDVQIKTSRNFIEGIAKKVSREIEKKEMLEDHLATQDQKEFEEAIQINPPHLQRLAEISPDTKKSK